MSLPVGVGVWGFDSIKRSVDSWKPPCAGEGEKKEIARGERSNTERRCYAQSRSSDCRKSFPAEDAKKRGGPEGRGKLAGGPKTYGSRGKGGID